MKKEGKVPYDEWRKKERFHGHYGHWLLPSTLEHQ
jgi:hypothetical protein